MGKWILVAASLFAVGGRADISTRLSCSDPFRSVKIVDRSTFYQYEIGDDKFRPWEIEASLTDKSVVWKQNELTEYSAIAHLKRIDGKGLASIPLSERTPDGGITVRVFCFEDNTIYPPPPRQ